MKHEQIIQKNSNKKEQKNQKKLIAPEIDKRIREEAKLFASERYKRTTHGGFYNWY